MCKPRMIKNACAVLYKLRDSLTNFQIVCEDNKMIGKKTVNRKQMRYSKFYFPKDSPVILFI